MAFLSASTSFTRFRITDPVSNELLQQVPDLLKRYAFRDIDDTADERAFGWTSFEDMLDTAWRMAPPEKGQYLAFSLRLDTRRLSPAVFKKHFTIATNQALQEAKEQGRKFLSRERKKEIRELVRLKLMARVLPIPAVFDVVWNLSTHTILFGSTQSKVLDLFNNWFTDTFDLHLEQMTPFAQALHLLGPDATAKLETMEAAEFV